MRLTRDVSRPRVLPKPHAAQDFWCSTAWFAAARIITYHPPVGVGLDGMAGPERRGKRVVTARRIVIERCLELSCRCGSISRLGRADVSGLAVQYRRTWPGRPEKIL